MRLVGMRLVGMRLVGMRLVGPAERRIFRERAESDGSSRNLRRIADARGTLTCLSSALFSALGVTST
jgi:hypothetical protein